MIACFPNPIPKRVGLDEAASAETVQKIYPSPL